MTLGTFIKENRLNKHLTQEDMTEWLVLPKRIINNWENDVCYPNIYVVWDLAKILDVSIHDILNLINRKMKKATRKTWLNLDIWID